MSLKLPIAELIESVKDELLCYEGAEKIAKNWESGFQKWLEKNKKHKDIKEVKGVLIFQVKDEEDIFEIADSYMDAVDEGKVKQYWNEF